MAARSIGSFAARSRAGRRFWRSRPFTDASGIGRCRLSLDQRIVPVEPRPYRPFQGWRYLAAKDAPARYRHADGNRHNARGHAAGTRRVGIVVMKWAAFRSLACSSRPSLPGVAGRKIAGFRMSPAIRRKPPPGCELPAKPEEAGRLKQQNGFVDLGNGTQVRISGRVRVDAGSSLVFWARASRELPHANSHWLNSSVECEWRLPCSSQFPKAGTGVTRFASTPTATSFKCAIFRPAIWTRNSRPSSAPCLLRSPMRKCRPPMSAMWQRGRDGG